MLGVVQAARWHRGLGHRRTDPIDATLSHSHSSLGGGGEGIEVPFHQKLAKEKAKLSSRRRQQQTGDDDQGIGNDHQSLKNSEKSGGKFSSLLRSVSPPSSSSMSMTALNQPVPQFPPVHTLSQSHYPQSHPNRSTTPSGRDSTRIRKGDRDKEMSQSQSHLTKRQRNAILASQKKTTDRLTALNSVSAVGGTAKEFRCSDGITVMPYIVEGNLSVNVKRCNFVVIHDFFDTADATSLLMKNITAHHDGCQALCFNYPGQSNTVWPRLPVAERERGALEPVHNNDWIAGE